MKNPEATLEILDLSKAFDSISSWKREQKQLVYGLPKESVTAIMILYENTKAVFRSSDSDTNFGNDASKELL